MPVGIQVYGVDERFWVFHGLEAAGQVPEPGRVLVSAGLAGELGVAVDETLLVRVQKPSSIPVGSLHGRRDDLGETMRLTIQAVLSSDDLGEFSFRPQQGLSRAVFVRLGRMQRDLEIDRQANTMLLGTGGGGEETDTAAAVATIETALRSQTPLEDLGVRVRVLEGRGQLVVESAAGLLSDDTVVAAPSGGGRGRHDRPADPDLPGQRDPVRGPAHPLLPGDRARPRRARPRCRRPGRHRDRPAADRAEQLDSRRSTGGAR